MTLLHRIHKSQRGSLLALSILLIVPFAAHGQLLSGYSLSSRELSGPNQSILSTAPIWVVDYHTLVINYRASGHLKADAPVITLRPGSVGPITPRSNNPENPLASGEDLVIVRGQGLTLDGAPHSLRIELKGKIKTPQIDALIFSLPADAKLNLIKLQFLADPGFLPCNAPASDDIPPGSQPLTVHGPLKCGDAPATSLRGHESITIEAQKKQAKTLYLDLYSYLAGFTTFDPAAPLRPSATSETSLVIASIRYADHPSTPEQQFPILVSTHRHTLLNRKRALYALQLDPTRRLLSVELEDHSPHIQLVLFHAALSKSTEESIDEPAFPSFSPTMSAQCKAETVLNGSEWFHVSDTSGGSLSTIKTSLHKTPSLQGVALDLTLTNTSDTPADVVVLFPSLRINVSSDPHDVTYLFPQMVAIISSQDAALSAEYGPNFLMQFTDVFASHAGCGAAVLVEDTSGQSKTFHLKKQGDSVTDQTEYHIRIAPHQTYSPPSATIALHNGDWHTGFDTYKQWLSTWYEPHTPHPAWLQRSFYMRRDYPLGGSGLLFDDAHNQYTFDRLEREAQLFGGIDFIDISGWALSDTLGRVGDYPIELGTPANLRANIQQASRENIPTGLYFEGYLIDKNSAIARKHGAQWQMIGRDGKGVWWPHDSPEMYVCPSIRPWQSYLSNRMASVAKETDARAVYLDEFGCSNHQCFASDHGHEVGANTINGQIEMMKQVRNALDGLGRTSTIVYTECPPVDIGAPYTDGSFTYALPSSRPEAYGTKLNLWRFAFPKVRLWDMVSSGVEPHILSAEDFRLAFWLGDGVWLKGRADTWYGSDILEFLRWAHPLLLQHADALSGEAEPLIASPDPHILINRFRSTTETVYTLFNNTYETRSFKFQGRSLTLPPRGVDLIAQKNNNK